jgi:serine/threonine-protein kinase
LKKEGDHESHYRIIKRLGGASGMGQVFLAFDENLERDVAIKYPSPQTNPARFFVGGKAAARLNHLNIIKIYHMSKDPTYMVMEYLEGGDLRGKLDNPSWDYQEKLFTLEKIIDALSYAHLKNVIHRDLKPENIMFDAMGRPVVVDFDLSKLKDSSEFTNTIEGMSMGTPPYMSPEQVLGKIKLISPATDIYSVGVLIFEILLGSRVWPINGETIEEIMVNHVKNQPENFYKKAMQLGLNSKLDEKRIKKISDIVDRCLKKQPEERYKNGKELLEDWKKILTPVSSIPENKKGKIEKKCSYCGFIVNTDEKYCPNCGALIDNKIDKNRVVSAVNAEKKRVKEEKRDIICPSCGFKNDKTASFCENCGVKLKENKVIEPKGNASGYCVCGEKIVAGVKFCPNCGKRW